MTHPATDTGSTPVKRYNYNTGSKSRRNAGKAQRTPAAIRKGGIVVVFARHQLAGDFDLLGAAKVGPKVLTQTRGRVIVSACVPGVHGSVIALQMMKQPVQISGMEHRAQNFAAPRANAKFDDPAVSLAGGTMCTTASIDPKFTSNKAVLWTAAVRLKLSCSMSPADTVKTWVVGNCNGPLIILLHHHGNLCGRIGPEFTS